MRNLFDLVGRKAIVTGGSRGLGLQIARALVEQGAQVLLTARKADELAAAVDELNALAAASRAVSATSVSPASVSAASAIACDLSDPAAIVAFASQAIERLGHCDILVNNAGASWVAPAEDHPLNAWQKLVDVNLTGLFVLTQEIGRRSMILRRYGRILNIASIAGLSGNPMNTNKTIAYNTTKGGVVNFTRALAGEWGEHGITVNALAPGFFPSRMTRGALTQMQAKLNEITPLRRIGDDQDLQGAALLFCSDAGKHITGQILAVDGGVSAL